MSVTATEPHPALLMELVVRVHRGELSVDEAVRIFRERKGLPSGEPRA